MASGESRSNQSFALKNSELLRTALAHHQAGRLLQAQSLYSQILQTEPTHPDALHFSGVLAQQAGRPEIAIDLMTRSIAANPSNPVYYGNLGTALEKLGRLDEAAATYRKALSLNPNDAEAQNNLGYVLQQQGMLDEAIDIYRKAILLKPDFAEAYDNLGSALQQQGKLEQAVANYNKAISLNPGFALAHNNLGSVLLEFGKSHKAIASYDRALFFQPDFAQAISNKALAQLLQGNFSDGWKNYEWRWQSVGHNTVMRSYPYPFWKGEKLPSGNLLIWGEQGVGDEIMFAGLIPDALRTGNNCVLDCDARLMPLFARSFPGVTVVHGYNPEKNHNLNVSAHLPSGSLPGLFRNSSESFGATTSPYLFADPEKRDKFRTRYSDGRKLIGLAWSTTNQKRGPKRSIDLSSFAQLFAHPDIRWISLQYGDLDKLETQAATSGAPILIDRTVDQLSDIDTFAAQVAAMDLVITIDNSTAHLAGALGVPVWVLLPFAPDWRWLEEREDSPWYPSMCLFRQSERGNWQSVLQKVRNAL